jgi:indole-3-glycerol phosphate synthase
MSVSKQARRRGAILDEIMRYQRDALPKQMRDIPLADLRALANVAPLALDFHGALKQPGVSLIAECKKASPSKGLLVRDYKPVELAQTYIRGGAQAISVLTNARYFQGSLADLRDIKEGIAKLKPWVRDRHDPRLKRGVPVLRKDFIFDPYQVYEARAAGADAILLIVAVLAPRELQELLSLARSLDMEALVEVHTADELEQALDVGPRVIGINNRDLQTFEVDFDNTARLRSRIPAPIATVAESGIRTADDVRRLADIGVDAILVGESLVKSKDVLAATQALVQAGDKQTGRQEPK